jgi:hypothetical protein
MYVGVQLDQFVQGLLNMECTNDATLSVDDRTHAAVIGMPNKVVTDTAADVDWMLTIDWGADVSHHPHQYSNDGLAQAEVRFTA